MEALLPAFIAVLLAELDGRVQHEAAAQVQSNNAPLNVLFVLILTTATGMGVAAAGGAYVLAHMTWKGSILLAGLALVIAGATMVWPRKAVAAPDENSGITTQLWRFALVQFGDNAQFIVFALGVWARAPVLAASAGFVAILAAALPPMLFAREWRTFAPWRLLRQAGAAIMIMAGLYAAHLALS